MEFIISSLFLCYVTERTVTWIILDHPSIILHFRVTVQKHYEYRYEYTYILRNCRSFQYDIGPAWELRPKSPHSKRRRVRGSGTYIDGSDDDNKLLSVTASCFNPSTHLVEIWYRNRKTVER